MRNPLQRIFALALALAAFLPAAHGLGELMAPGNEPYLTVGCAAGLVLSAVWRWSGRLVAIASPAVGLALAGFVNGANHAPPAHGTWLLAHAAQLLTHGLPAAAFIILLLASSCFATCCGWLLFRLGTPWPVVALAGTALLIRADVTRVYEDRFPLFIIVALLLVGICYAPNARRLWLALPAATVGVAVVGLCWQLPSAEGSWSPNWFNSVASLAGVHGTAGGGDRQILSLTQPFHPGNDLLMAITLDREKMPWIGGRAQQVSLVDSVPRLPYWQSAIFERYDGHSWTTAESVERSLAPGQLAAPLIRFPASTMRAAVEVFEPTQDLVSAGTLLQATVPTVASYPRDGSGPLEVQASTTLNSGSIYRIESSGTDISGSSARNVNADLQLPDVPTEVRTLAQRLVQGRPTVLAAAMAIESYLRDSGRFTYDVTAASSPDRDAVDDFLFYTHRGFCNQFASAMVVLTREAGIPARLISGYDTGTVESGAIELRQRDAHSWAEVFVPGSGWVALDPTPGFGKSTGGSPRPTAHALPGGSRPPGTISIPRTSGTPTTSRIAARNSGSKAHSSRPIAPYALGIALFIAMLAGIYAVRPRSLDELYVSAVKAAPRRYGRLQPGDTPREFADRVVGPGREDMERLVDLYTRHRYARIEPSPTELRAARRVWRRLRRRWLVRSPWT